MRYMARFLLFSLFFLLSFSACEKREAGAPEEMHWDRDMCERCKMAISERKFAAQIINPQNGKVYKFDDIGCAVLWMDETQIPWREQAIIWVIDASTGKWIDAKKAHYSDDSITPMAFGFAAYSDKTAPKGKTLYDFDTVSDKIREIEKVNTQKVRSY